MGLYLLLFDLKLAWRLRIPKSKRAVCAFLRGRLQNKRIRKLKRVDVGENFGAFHVWLLDMCKQWPSSNTR